VLYFVDLVLRISQWTRKVEVVVSKTLDGNVTYLELRCPSVVKKLQDMGGEGVGSFVMLHCREASLPPDDLHPFTVSGIDASKETLKLHVRSQGSGTWTGRVLDACKTGSLRLRLEGPYGRMGLRLSDYHTLVSVAGGVGITPSGRLLELALDDASRRAHFPNLKRLVLVWAVQEKLHLGWFEDLLVRAQNLSRDVEGGGSQGSSGLEVQLKLHVTRGPDASEKYAAAPIQLSEARQEARMSDLLRTLEGRPQLDEILRSLGDAGSGQRRGVLVCGPSMLQREASAAAEGLGFDLHRETFEL